MSAPQSVPPARRTHAARSSRCPAPSLRALPRRPTTSPTPRAPDRRGQERVRQDRRYLCISRLGCQGAAASRAPPPCSARAPPAPARWASPAHPRCPYRHHSEPRRDDARRRCQHRPLGTDHPWRHPWRLDRRDCGAHRGGAADALHVPDGLRHRRRPRRRAPHHARHAAAELCAPLGRAGGAALVARARQPLQAVGRVGGLLRHAQLPCLHVHASHASAAALVAPRLHRCRLVALVGLVARLRPGRRPVDARLPAPLHRAERLDRVRPRAPAGGEGDAPRDRGAAVGDEGERAPHRPPAHTATWLGLLHAPPPPAHRRSSRRPP